MFFVLLLVLFVVSVQHPTATAETAISSDRISEIHSDSIRFPNVLRKLCLHGDLNHALYTLRNMTVSAEVAHSIAALELILHGDIESALTHHRQAKMIDKTVLPPLAKLHLGKIFSACSCLPCECNDGFFIHQLSLPMLCSHNL